MTVPFFAEHGAGDNYPAGAVVYDGNGETQYMRTCTDEGFAFHVDDNGNPIVTDYHREFWAVWKRVEKYINTGEGLEIKALTVGGTNA